MEYVTLSNGVKMHKNGYGVYQISKEDCERCVIDAQENMKNIMFKSRHGLHLLREEIICFQMKF